jgi:acyl dehydratase
VSLGYDRIRFVAPVYAGDTLTARYTILELDPATRRSRARVEVRKASGELAATGEHLMKWLPPDAGSGTP